MSSTGQPAPPGWYSDPAGARRYWDGQRWGAYAEPQGSGSWPVGPAQSYRSGPPSTTPAVIAHIGGLFSIFVPLVVYLVTDRSANFNKAQAAEALNFQLTVLICGVAFVFAAFFVAVVTLGIGLIVLFPAVVAAWVIHVVWCIKAAVVASRGQAWRYPVCIRMVG